jgi:hypothetical protein
MTAANYQAIWHHISEDRGSNLYQYENTKYLIASYGLFGRVCHRWDWIVLILFHEQVTTEKLSFE